MFINFNNILLALKDQLYGRVLGKDIKINSLMYLKNQQIDDSLSILLANHLKIISLDQIVIKTEYWMD